MRKRGRLTRHLVHLIEERIAGCSLCSGQRPQVSVDELCGRLRLRGSESERVVRSLICPNCEAGPHLYDTLAEWEPNEWAEALRSRRWQRAHEHRLWSLVELLERTPSLGLSHPTGRDLHASVRHARITTLTDNPWWRGCCKNEPSAPPPIRFLPANPHAVAIPAQRFNHAGQVALYVSDSPDTAAAETLREEGEEGELWLAALTFQRPVRLLDFRIRILGDESSQGLLFSGLNLSQPRDLGDQAPREYVLTRFIADLVRSRPLIDGAVYTSSRLAPFGTNVVAVRDVPVVVTTAPARYRWSWKMFGAPFDAARSHMKAEVVP